MGFCKFITRLYEMANDSNNEEAIGFNSTGVYVELRNIQLLTNDVLPRFFKTGNITSFVRQLHNYGFRTKPLRPSSGVSQCFYHPDFIRGRADLCMRITKRKSNTSTASAVAASTKERSKNDSDTNSDDGNVSVLFEHSNLTYQQLVQLNAELVRRNVELMSHVEHLERLLGANNNKAPSPTNRRFDLAKSPSFTLPGLITTSAAAPANEVEWLGVSEMNDAEWLEHIRQLGGNSSST